MDYADAVLEEFLTKAKEDEDLAYILSTLGPEDLETVKNAIHDSAETIAEKA